GRHPATGGPRRRVDRSGAFGVAVGARGRGGSREAGRLGPRGRGHPRCRADPGARPGRGWGARGRGPVARPSAGAAGAPGVPPRGSGRRGPARHGRLRALRTRPRRGGRANVEPHPGGCPRRPSPPWGARPRERPAPPAPPPAPRSIRLFALGDTHLPSTRAKDMHRFGWTDHPAPLAAAWDATVRDGDLVVLVGDLSWATRPHEALGDLAWIHDRPGQKGLVRGNHDGSRADSAARLRGLLADFASIVGFLDNRAVQVGPHLIAGSRLWTAPEARRLPTAGALGDEPTDDRYVTRELRRLRASIADADRL